MKAKRIALSFAAALAALAAGGAVFVAVEAAAYSASLDKVYDVPLPALTASTDPVVIARGKHVTEAIAACSTSSCHGADLGGGQTVAMGPVGHFTGPNISMGGLGLAYSDGELARLLRHGLKRDGRTVRFMPVQDFRWLPDDDVAAVVAYVRSAPAVDRANGSTDFGTLGKVLDRRDQFVIDVARRIDHGAFTPPPPRGPGADYVGCHGEHYAGGPIPGAPSSMPVPRNLTPSEDGLLHWSYQDFDHALTQGVRPDGKRIDPFMPLDSFGKLDDTEKQALWAFLRTLPARPFGQR
jgi:hypothetical protein